MLNSTFANAVLKSMFGKGTLYTKSTIYTNTYSDVTGGLGSNCYIGLFSGDTEYSDDNYVRQVLGTSSLNVMSDPSDNEIHNTEFIKFNPLAEGASDVSFDSFGLFATKTGGKALYTAKLKEALTGLSAGEMPVFNKSALSVSFGKDDTTETVANASLSAEG